MPPVGPAVVGVTRSVVGRSIVRPVSIVWTVSVVAGTVSIVAVARTVIAVGAGCADRDRGLLRRAARVDGGDHDLTVGDAPFAFDADRPLAKMRIGYLKTEFEPATSPPNDTNADKRRAMYQEALEVLRKAGANLQPIELPKFSAYVSGKIEKVNATRVLRIPDAQGITFKTGTLVQVSNDSQAQDSVTLGAPATGAGGGFIIDDANFSIRDGNVKFRTQVDSGAGTAVFRDFFYNVFRLTSLGGLMNVSGAAVYGGLVYGIGGLINGVRMIFASNTTYPA